MTKRPSVTWIDTLKLSDADHRSLLEELHANVQPAAHEQRTGARYHYDLPGGVLMKVFSAGTPPVHYLVRPRNLSSGGIGILHGNYLHVGTRCNFILRKTDGHCAAVNGSIAWCRHFRGRVHELGVKFAQSINVHEFIDHSTPDSITGKTTSPSTSNLRLAGCVLLVGGSIDDQELLRYYLHCLGADLQTAGDPASALKRAQAAGIHLIVLDDQPAGMNTQEFVSALSTQGCKVPVVLLAAAQSQPPAVQGLAGVLPKPFSVDDVVRTTSLYLPQASIPGDASPIFSENWHCTDMRPVILGFLSRLKTQLAELTRLAGQGESKSQLVRKCQDLKSAAGGYGYPPISDAASQLQEAITLNAAQSVTDALAALTHVCEAAARVRGVDEEPVAASL